MSPFQGLKIYGLSFTQGVALGYNIFALTGRGTWGVECGMGIRHRLMSITEAYAVVFFIRPSGTKVYWCPSTHQ